MSYPSRLVGLDAARARFGARADRIAAYFSQSDELGDAAAAALLHLPTGQRRSVVDQGLAPGAAWSDPATPAALIELFRQLAHVPFWVDPDRCSRGGEVFFRCGPLGGIALGFGSLARAYCSSGGNKPLALTRALIDQAPKRVANTGEFVRAVSAPDGLRVGGPGFKAVANVRLMHARVRLALQSAPSWRAEAWGVPINQADMAVTALLFSHGFATFVRKIGVQVSDREEEDLLHLWRYAGYLMGVREELLCATVGEAQQLADVVDLIDAGPDEDTRSLLEPLLAREQFEVALRSRRMGHAVHRMYVAACREMIGDAYADRVGLPRGTGDVFFRKLLRPAISALGQAHQLTPGATQRAQRAGEHYWNKVSASRSIAP
jgi:hypothetical protein